MEKMRHYIEGNYYCHYTDKSYKTVRGLLNVIRKHNHSLNEYYDMFNPVKYCICGNKAKFSTREYKYETYCSTKCKINAEGHWNTKENSKHYSNQESVNNAVRKMKETNSLKSPTETNAILDKRRATIKEKHGVNFYSVKTKKQWKNTSVEKKKQIVNKALKTKKQNGTMCVLPYKNKSRYKTYNNISFYCQGYEDAVLEYLIVDKKYNVNDIKMGKYAPRIELTNGKKYYPDIYIESINLLIEVKSDYTWKCDIDNNILKAKCSKEAGYNHIFFITESIKKDRTLNNKTKRIFSKMLNKAISSHATKVEGFND